MQTSKPLVKVFAFPDGPNGTEWSTTVLADDDRALSVVVEQAKFFEASVDCLRKIDSELKLARDAADIEDGMPLDDWIIAARNDHAVMTNARNVAQAENDALRERLEQAQQFIRSLMAECDYDGTVHAGTRINMHKAESLTHAL